MESYSSRTSPAVTRPTLVVDRARAVRNIARMAAKAKAAGVRFRPHFKTHQSAEIGDWFRECGVDAITVSSLEMARGFARHGWSDITVAFPVNLLEMDTINQLAVEVDLGLVVDSRRAVGALNRSLVAHARVWIKVDTGYGRVGVPWDRPEDIASLAEVIAESPALAFEGILTHSGQSYAAGSREEILEIHHRAVERMTEAADAIRSRGISECKVSIGDTPTASVAEDFRGVDELRPGNFVFYDAMQYRMGTCAAEDVAVAVACPVIGRYEARGEIAVYGGAVHLSKESLMHDGRPIFGYLATGGGRSLGSAILSAPVVSLTQEHGVVRVERSPAEGVQPGEIVLVVPVHACLTCNLYPEYLTLEGDVIARL